MCPDCKRPFTGKTRPWCGHMAVSDNDYYDALEAKVQQLEAEIADLRRWKNAVIDAGVVNWTLSKANEDDPRQALRDLIANAIQQWDDSAISEHGRELQTLRAKAELADWMYKALRHENSEGEFVGGDAYVDVIEFGHRYDALEQP